MRGMRRGGGLGRAVTEFGDARASTPSWRCAIRRRDEPGQTIAVVSPCGACRELIFDYDAEGARHRAGGNVAGGRADRRIVAEQIPPGRRR